MSKRPLALAIGVFSGGFALGLALMLWAAPDLIDSRWLHIMRLTLIWLAGSVAVGLLWWRA